MPIEIRKVQALHSVVQRMRDYEAQYGITSAQFARDDEARSKVPEFDAIEWNFLLMQKAAMEEDNRCGSVFSSNCMSKTHAVDARAFYDEVAA